MSTVADLLKTKGQQVFSVSPETPVLEALRLMAEKRIGALLVMDGKQPAGIFSERDFVRQLAQDASFDVKMPVKKFMTTHLYTITSNHSVGDCMAVMTEHRIRHLPVIDSGDLVGLISIGDVVKQAIAVREERIGHLEDYMSGKVY
ncbi:MAG: CBS domain-containing protein [Anaerolineae bacterium]|nr:CBS domain-containing protein [Anaerolineae bacterium]